MTDTLTPTPKKPKALTNRELQKNVNSMGEQLDAVTDAVNQLGESQVSIDAKLDNIQLQVGAVQANVEALKEQSERQTAQIIRRIERMDTSRPRQ